MTSKIIGALVLALWFIGCVAQSAVREHFNQSGYSYPLQVKLPTDGKPRLVCPGCDQSERLVPEYGGLLRSGLKFIETGFSVEYLRTVTNANIEAFLVSDAYLFEDPPGGQIGIAVDLSAFRLAALENREIYIPHVRYPTTAGEVLELRNLLILRRTDQGWEYGGWVY